VETDSTFCTACGAANPTGAKFCNKCGASIQTEGTADSSSGQSFGRRQGDFITLTCPSCGGKLQITPDMDRFVCQHCENEHLVRRSGGAVSLVPVVEGLKRVETKFDSVLSGSDRMASEQTIQRLKAEIPELEEEIAAKEQIIKENSPSRSGVFWGIITIIIGIIGAVAVSRIASIHPDDSWIPFLALVCVAQIPLIIMGIGGIRSSKDSKSKRVFRGIITTIIWILGAGAVSGIASAIVDSIASGHTDESWIIFLVCIVQVPLIIVGIGRIRSSKDSKSKRQVREKTSAELTEVQQTLQDRRQQLEELHLFAVRR